ncbi:MAG: tetratricopeptide repeat protein [Magnetococcales bacterium]|nr:tetratricopeptide repeat protein [Magnetococcales bacterium]
MKGFHSGLSKGSRVATLGAALLLGGCVANSSGQAPLGEEIPAEGATPSAAASGQESALKQWAESANKQEKVFNNYLLGQILLGERRWLEAEEAFVEVVEADPDNTESRMFVAHLATQRGDLDRAVSFTRELVEREPDHDQARLLLASVLTAQKEYDEAARHYQELLKLTPDNERARELLAQLYGRMGQPEAAKEVLTPLFSNPDLAWSAYLALGRAYANNQDMENAIAAFRKSWEMAPDQLESVLSLGAALQKVDRLQEAEDVYRSYLTDQPSSAAIHNRLARLLLNQDKREKALEEFKTILRLTPDSVQARLTTALILFSQSKHAEALKELRLAEAIEPENSGVRYYLGQVLETLDQNAEAEIQYLKVGMGETYYPEAQLRIALIESEKEMKPEAIDRLVELRRAYPERMDLILALSVLMLQTKDYQGVVDTSNEGLKLEADQSRLLFNRAMALDKLKRWPEAEADLRAYIAMNADDAHALNYLGYTWAERNENLEEAYELLQRASKLAPGDGFITDSLGWVLYRLNRLDESLNFMRQAVRMEPEDATIKEHLGDVLHALGLVDEAVEVWRNSLELDSDNSQLQEKIEQYAPNP